VVSQRQLQKNFLENDKNSHNECCFPTLFSSCVLAVICSKNSLLDSFGILKVQEFCCRLVLTYDHNMFLFWHLTRKFIFIINSSYQFFTSIYSYQVIFIKLFLSMYCHQFFLKNLFYTLWSSYQANIANFLNSG
jgi:hypothetical protein